MRILKAVGVGLLAGVVLGMIFNDQGVGVSSARVCFVVVRFMSGCVRLATRSCRATVPTLADRPDAQGTTD